MTTNRIHYRPTAEARQRLKWHTRESLMGLADCLEGKLAREQLAAKVALDDEVRRSQSAQRSADATAARRAVELEDYERRVQKLERTVVALATLLAECRAR